MTQCQSLLNSQTAPTPISNMGQKGERKTSPAGYFLNSLPLYFHCFPLIVTKLPRPHQHEAPNPIRMIGAAKPPSKLWKTADADHQLEEDPADQEQHDAYRCTRLPCSISAVSPLDVPCNIMLAPAATG